jgi:hypothetical protein
MNGIEGVRDELARTHPAWAAEQAVLMMPFAGADCLRSANMALVTRCSCKSSRCARVTLRSGDERGDGAMALHGFAGFARHQVGS